MTETTDKAKGTSKPAKAYSCVRCFERKVKCDKEHPCAGCVRSGVECIFRIPAPPRRKKKRTQEDILHERLNQYEQILQEKGIDIATVSSSDDKTNKETPSEQAESVAQSEPTSTAPKTVTTTQTIPRLFVTPKLTWEQGKSRFTENNLWTRVAEEFRNDQNALHESSDSEDEEEEFHEAEDNVGFTLGYTPVPSSGRNLHPPPQQISILWQIFLENVNPFSMLIHRPTMHASIQKAMANLDHVPRNLEAMMFAMYSAALVSMSDEEVEELFGEAKRSMLARYHRVTKAALARAKFMGTSDVLVLQAFVLFLLSMRDIYDGRTLWTLSGVALRIGEGMGLHKDGTILDLPPFETELRRRIWYQITTLDYRSAELSGSLKFSSFALDQKTTRAPLNINDEDIWPGMTEPPVPHKKITEMVLCVLRYEFPAFWVKRYREKAGKGGASSIWDNYLSPDNIEEIDAAIDELEQIIEEKYVRYCDPAIPNQLMASVIARTAPNSMRFMAHHPRRWATDDQIPPKERKLLWDLCIRISDAYNMCVTSHSLKKFLWHTSFYFQWQVLIYMLDCVRAEPLMPEADDAWRRIQDIFTVHPNFITDTRKAIHIAVGSLCLKAYATRENALKQEGRFLPARPPKCVQMLRKQREEARVKQAQRRAKAQARAESQPQPQPQPRRSSDLNDLVNMMGFEAASSVAASQQQQQQSHIQQLPLPPLQAPNDLQQQQGQLAAPFWFDNFNNMSQITGSDMDWMTLQDASFDQGSQMDWSAWDDLLRDGGVGSLQFGAAAQAPLWR